MNTRTMPSLGRAAVALLLAASLPLAAASAQSAATSEAPTGAPPAHHKLPPTTHLPHNVATQNRELDQIGNKLLRETPSKPVNSTASEGGGLEPPTH